MEKVIINSHWICDGEDKIGKEMTVDIEWLKSIKINFTIVKDDAKKK